MSRSYAHYKYVGNCYGSNQKYYKIKRRLYRSKWKQNFMRALDNADRILSGFITYDPEYETVVDDLYVHPEKVSKFKDTWREPTDGGWHITAKDVKEMYDSGEYKRRRGLYKVKNKNRVKK